MDLGTVQSVAQNQLNNGQCSELKEILSKFGYGSELEDLQRTVETIIAVFRNAAKQYLDHEERGWIKELKDAVFEANNMLDKFVTLAEQKQQVEGSSRGFLARKLSPFFTYPTSYKISRGLKNISKKLDAKVSNHQKFGLKIDFKPLKERWHEETCSYVDQGNIIGRKEDLESIVGTLLASNNDQPDVSFLSIAGMVGLGKTSLAQLVYNDPRVASAFPLRFWTCVADHDQHELDLEKILREILASATVEKQADSTMEAEAVHNKEIT